MNYSDGSSFLCRLIELEYESLLEMSFSKLFMEKKLMIHLLEKRLHFSKLNYI